MPEVDVDGQLGGFLQEVERRVRESPYSTLAMGVGVGYVAGGGLFSSWTRPLVRAALGALLVPSFREKVMNFATDFRSSGATTGA